MSNIILKNNILYYFLISSLHPKKKIYELINTKDKETYIEAQEILGIYIGKKKSEMERIKIESRNNSFHIFITNEQLIFLSYSNKKFFSTEQNFQLFDEIYYYLINNMKDRIFNDQSFLIEDEKEEIKDIINNHIGDAISIKTNDSYIGSGDTVNMNEKEILQVDINNGIINEEEKYENENKNINQDNNIKNNNKNIIAKKLLKNFSNSSYNELNEKSLQEKNKEKKNESSEENIIKKRITNKPSLPYVNSNKTNNLFIKHESSNPKITSSKTVPPNHSKLKNKILERLKSNDIKEKPKISKKTITSHDSNKNYRYNKFSYDNLNLKKNKPDSCSKTPIIVILISIIVLQLAAIPLIINFYDFSL